MVRMEKADIVVEEATKDVIKGHIRLRARKIDIPFEANTKDMRGIKVDLELPDRLQDWSQARLVKNKIKNICGKINVPYSEAFEVRW